MSFSFGNNSTSTQASGFRYDFLKFVLVCLFTLDDT